VYDLEATLCDSELSNAIYFFFYGYKLTIIAEPNCFPFLNIEMGCTGQHEAEMAYATYQKKKLHQHWLQRRVGRTWTNPIVVEDDGEDDGDEWSKLGDLIVEAEVGLQAEAGQ
jgi:hypothetical protein